MSNVHSDALVFFGATGDLAYKKIFPALQSMIKRGNLCVPVIGVAKAGWNLDQFKARAQDSLRKSTVDWIPATWLQTLSSLLRYVDGDYADPYTFQTVRKQLGSAEHPAHYLAIPPVLFGKVIEQLVASGNVKGARVIVEKPFGRDLASALELNRILSSAFAESDIFRIDHYLGNGVRSTVWFSSASLTPSWSPSGIGTTLKVSRLRWRKISACRAGAASTIKSARSATSSRTTSSRCSVTSRWSPPWAPTANPFATKRSKY